MSSSAMVAPYPSKQRFAAASACAGFAGAAASWVVGGQPALAVAFVAVWWAIAGRRLHLHGRPTLDPPMHVTLVRGAASGLVAGAVLRPELDWLLAGVAALALALDYLDGWLARRLGLVSPFGAWADQELDALFIVVLSLACLAYGRAGPWIVAAGAYRYAFLGAGHLVPRLARPLKPRRSRAWACGLVIAAMLLSLMPPVPADVAHGVNAAGLLVLTWSFALDLRPVASA